MHQNLLILSLEAPEAREQPEDVIAVEELISAEIHIGEATHFRSFPDLFRQKAQLAPRSIQRVEAIAHHLFAAAVVRQPFWFEKRRNKFVGRESCPNLVRGGCGGCT